MSFTAKGLCVLIALMSGFKAGVLQRLRGAIGAWGMQSRSTRPWPKALKVIRMSGSALSTRALFRRGQDHADEPSAGWVWLPKVTVPPSRARLQLREALVRGGENALVAFHDAVVALEVRLRARRRAAS